MSTSIDDAAAIVSQQSAPLIQSSRNYAVDQPVNRIRPAKFWEMINPRELWTHRAVLYFLIWRDLKARYKQSVLGAVWVVLQPVLTTIVFAIFLGRFLHAPSDGVPYPIFAYSSMLLWTFTSTAILSSSYSLVTNSQIITRIYFPRLTLPIAAVGVRLVDFTIAAVVLIAFMIYYGVSVSRGIMILPLLILEMTALALAIGILTAALYVRYRDIGTLLPIVLQVWMFVSPTLYSPALIPERFRFVYSLNPLVGIITGFRAALFNLPFDWRSITVSVIVTVFFLAASLQIFQLLDSSFADEV